LWDLSVKNLRCEVSSNFGFPLVSICKELFLVVEQLDAGLSGELKIGSLYDSIDGTSLLTESAVDALCHINIVTGGTARTVGTGLGLNSDGTGWANGFAQLASNASLLTRLVSTESVLTTEARAKRTLLKRIVQRGGLCEHIAGGYPDTLKNLSQKIVTSSIVPGKELSPRVLDFGLLNNNCNATRAHEFKLVILRS
jgi:hypothetical protein